MIEEVKAYLLNTSHKNSLDGIWDVKAILKDRSWTTRYMS